MNKNIIILAAGICLFFGFSFISVESKPIEITQYSSYVKFQDENLFSYADIVAAGKVVSVNQPKEMSIDIGGEQKPMIYKDYIFEINKSIKGDYPSGSKFIIRIPGGEIGKTKFVSDDVAPEPGQEQILFLKNWKYGASTDETYIILGGQQGKFLIDVDKVVNSEKTMTVATFDAQMQGFKNKYGNKVVLPPGFLR